MQKRLTPYPELDIVLTGHVNRIKEALEIDFIGAYLQGSLAIGDFDMTSDVDFIVVTRKDLSEDRVNLVQKVHNGTYGQNNRWVRRLEYSFFALKTIKTPSSPYRRGVPDTSEERKLWYFDNGHQTISRSDHCNTLVTRWTIRERGKTVLGPDPKTLIDPIDPADLKREIKDTLIGWGSDVIEDPGPYENRFYQAYLVLNFARMLQDLNEGRVTSKLQGARWAKKTLDPKWRDLIDHCWQDRQDPNISVSQRSDPKIYAQSIDFVRYAVDQARSY
jgi:predicted nucleotidyltransferase